MDLLCHPCITTTHLSYSCLYLKLPPPPCAVLLARPWHYNYSCDALALTWFCRPWSEGIRLGVTLNFWAPPSLVLASVVDSRTSLRLYLLGRPRLPHSVRDHGTPRMQKHFSGIARILPHLSFYFNLKVARNGSWGMTYITCKQATWTSKYGEVGAAIR